MKLPYK